MNKELIVIGGKAVFLERSKENAARIIYNLHHRGDKMNKNKQLRVVTNVARILNTEVTIILTSEQLAELAPNRINELCKLSMQPLVCSDDVKFNQELMREQILNREFSGVVEFTTD